MFCWYLNSKAGIYFDKLPSVGVRYYIPSMTKEEKKSIEKYPFICRKDLSVCLKDIRKNKEFRVGTRNSVFQLMTGFEPAVNRL